VSNALSMVLVRSKNSLFNSNFIFSNLAKSIRSLIKFSSIVEQYLQFSRLFITKSNDLLFSCKVTITFIKFSLFFFSCRCFFSIILLLWLLSCKISFLYYVIYYFLGKVWISTTFIWKTGYLFITNTGLGLTATNP